MATDRSRSNFTLIHQNAAQTQVLSSQMEKELLGTMDHALQNLCLTLFSTDSAMEAFSDLINHHENIKASVRDQWLTLQDVLSIHWHLGKNITDESYALVQLAADWIVQWPTNREAIFSLIHSLQKSLTTQQNITVSNYIEQYTHAKNTLINANLKLVAHIANRYRGKGIEVEELIQEGTLGVIQAANRFNASLGNRFSTYAYWWIQQALKQCLSDKRGAVRLPTNVTDRISKIETLKSQYLKQFGIPPTIQELHHFSGFDKEQLEKYQQIGNLGVSLDAPLPNSDSESHLDLLTSDALTVTEAINHWDDQRHVMTLLKPLPARHKLVICLYHGIDRREEKTFKDIAPMLGISLERTRQIYHEALRMIREQTQI